MDKLGSEVYVVKLPTESFLPFCFLGNDAAEGNLPSSLGAVTHEPKPFLAGVFGPLGWSQQVPKASLPACGPGRLKLFAAPSISLASA